jgi:PKD repeat protein
VYRDAKFVALVVLATLVGFGFLARSYVVRAASSSLEFRYSDIHDTLGQGFQGSTNTKTLTVGQYVCGSCLPNSVASFLGLGSGSFGFGANFTLKGTASWGLVPLNAKTPDGTPARADLQYNANNIKQGHTLDIQDTLSPQQGFITVFYSGSAKFGVFQDCSSGTNCVAGWQPKANFSLSTPLSGFDDIPCSLPLSGSATCFDSKDVSIANGTYWGVYLNIHLTIETLVQVTAGSGVTAIRVAVVSPKGPDIPDNTLNFSGPSPDTEADSIFVDCRTPVGSDLNYGLLGGYDGQSLVWAGDVSLSVTSKFAGKTLGTVSTLVTSGSYDVTNFGKVTGKSGSTPKQVDLGPVKANDVPPVITVPAAGHEFHGYAGVPLQFHGRATSVCGVHPTLSWDFGDGTGDVRAYNPQHTYADTGTYEFTLTARDVTGLTTSETFSIVVEAAPVIPDSTALSYTGDTEGDITDTVHLSSTLTDTSTGQPMANAPISFFLDDEEVANATTDADGVAESDWTIPLNTSVGAHTVQAAYDGDDSHANSQTSSVDFTVHPEDTGLSFTEDSDTSGQIKGVVHFRSILVYDDDQPLAGKLVFFDLDGTNVAHATTDANGVAEADWTIPLGTPAGAHTVQAKFLRHVNYDSAQTPATDFAVELASTGLTFEAGNDTSGLIGGLVHSSSVLEDGDGQPLANESESFFLDDTEVADATTDANGLAEADWTIPGDTLPTSSGATHSVQAVFAGDSNYAGSQTPSAAFTVSTVLEGLQDAIAAALVDDPGLAHSFQQQAASIASAPNAQAKAGKLQAFISHVNAQRGKALDSVDADYLIQLASDL